MWIGDIILTKVSVPWLDSIYTRVDNKILLALYRDTRIPIQHE